MSLEAIGAERRARMTLERRIGEIESRIRGLWVFPTNIPTGTVYRQLLVGSGNTLGTIDSTTYKGLKRASALTSVPSAVPTAIGTAYSDGLTAVYDLGSNPTATTGTLAWLTSASDVTAKDPGGGADIVIPNAASFQLREGQLILALSSYKVPISGAPGTYATVYVPAIVAV
jgi:hypothetical protein